MNAWAKRDKPPADSRFTRNFKWTIYALINVSTCVQQSQFALDNGEVRAPADRNSRCWNVPHQAANVNDGTRAWMIFHFRGHRIRHNLSRAAARKQIRKKEKRIIINYRALMWRCQVDHKWANGARADLEPKPGHKLALSGLEIGLACSTFARVMNFILIGSDEQKTIILQSKSFLNGKIGVHICESHEETMNFSRKIVTSVTDPCGRIKPNIFGKNTVSIWFVKLQNKIKKQEHPWREVTKSHEPGWVNILYFYAIDSSLGTPKRVGKKKKKKKKTEEERKLQVLYWVLSWADSWVWTISINNRSPFTRFIYEDPRHALHIVLTLIRFYF